MVHLALRHIAFRVSYEDLKKSLEWLSSINIKPVSFGSRKSIEPFIRPYQGNASVYFNDPDGNSFEFMCFVDVPEELKGVTEKLSLKIGKSHKMLARFEDTLKKNSNS